MHRIHDLNQHIIRGKHEEQEEGECIATEYHFRDIVLHYLYIIIGKKN